jgi:2,5-diketo-D-gluconate reductase A
MAGITPTITLRGAHNIPRVGLGTWPMDDAESERAVLSAIEAGYRLFDTAENYRNEAGVGRGMRASGVPREQLFVTTKFNREWHGEDLVREAYERSAERLDVEYIDLLLIHWPNPAQDRYVNAWRGMIRLRDEGLVCAIGVSNFKPAHLERLRIEVGEMPALNQVQLNPFITQAATREYDAAHGIVTESWAPISKGHERLMEQPLIAALAERYGKTPAQIVLRWHLELGLVTIPKSGNPERMRENIDVFDFALTPAEVAEITGLDGGAGSPADSDKFGH